eukprot:970495-Pyramimonas_sp.AAC.1
MRARSRLRTGKAVGKDNRSVSMLKHIPWPWLPAGVAVFPTAVPARALHFHSMAPHLYTAYAKADQDLRIR